MVVACTQGIARVLAIDTQSALEAYMLADDVTAKADVRGLDADALARSRLSGNGDVGLGEVGIEVQFNDTAHVKHDVVRFINAQQTIKQRARFHAPTEVCDVIHTASTASVGIASIALGFRECQLTRLETPDAALMHGAVGLHFVNAPVVGLQRIQACFGILRSSAFIFIIGGGSHDIRISA